MQISVIYSRKIKVANILYQIMQLDKDKFDSMPLLDKIIGRIVEKKPNHSEMSAMTGQVSLEPTHERIAQERQVTDQVQNFVTHKLIFVAEWATNNLGVIQDNGIL
jgi:hypothetical protein